MVQPTFGVSVSMGIEIEAAVGAWSRLLHNTPWLGRLLSPNDPEWLVVARVANIRGNLEPAGTYLDLLS